MGTSIWHLQMGLSNQGAIPKLLISNEKNWWSPVSGPPTHPKKKTLVYFVGLQVVQLLVELACNFVELTGYTLPKPWRRGERLQSVNERLYPAASLLTQTIRDLARIVEHAGKFSLTTCWLPSSLWISCAGGLILVYGDGRELADTLVDQCTHVHCIRNWVSSTGLAIPSLFRHELLFDIPMHPLDYSAHAEN